MGRIIHGHRTRRRSKEYVAWDHMIQRCTNSNHPAYERYGGRGITVCTEWLNSFEQFFKDMGLAPTPKHTLERKNNNDGSRFTLPS